MKTVTRRALLRVLAVGAGTSLVAACAPGAPAAPSAAPAKPATPQSIPTQPPPAVAKPAPTQAPPAATTAPQAAPAATVAATTAPQAAPAAKVQDATLVVVDGTEPNSLSPAAGAGPFQHVVNALYDGLIHWNERMELEPALATSWEASADGRTWTFKLRPDVQFHDGTPFTSEAVKATIAHIQDGETQSTRRSTYLLVKEVATPDPLTVRLTTDPPTPVLPILMADNPVKIVSPTALAKHGKDFGRNPVGTGPFRFVEWIPNDRVTTEVNERYWGPKPQVRRFVYRPIPEAAGRAIALRTGEADVVVNLPATDVEALRQDANLSIQTTPGLTIVQGELRQSKPPLNDVRVRRALNHAIDKDAIIANVMRGMALPLNTPSIPGLWGTADQEPLRYDPNRAKQLLAEAGFPSGTDVTIVHISGRWGGDDQVVEAIQGYWNNVGIRTTIRKMALADSRAVATDDPDNLPGTMFFLIKINQDVTAHLYLMYHSASTMQTASPQRTGYRNPAVDDLIGQAQRTFESERRLQFLKQAQDLIWQDQPTVPLFLQVNVWGHRKNVSGFTFLPSNQLVPAQVRKA